MATPPSGGGGVSGAGDAAARFLLSLQQYLGSTDGRDKLYRLVQYASKLFRGAATLSHVTAAPAASGATLQTPPSTADAGAMPPLLAYAVRRALSLELVLSDSRKLFRLAAGVNIIAKRVRAARQRQQAARGGGGGGGGGDAEPARAAARDRRDAASAASLLEALADLGIFSFYALDHAAWLYRANVLGADAATSAKRGSLWMQRAGRCFVVAKVASVLLRAVQGRRQLRALFVAALAKAAPRRQLAALAGGGAGDGGARDAAASAPSPWPGKLRRESARAALAAARAPLVDMVRQACDIVIGLNMSRPNYYSPLKVGACGVVSSTIQVAQLWPPTPAPGPTTAAAVAGGGARPATGDKPHKWS